MPRPWFCGFLSLLLFFVAAVSGHSNDVQKIPADLRYEFKQIPAEENAFTEWLQAEKLLTDLPEDVEEAFNVALSIDGKQPTAEQIAKGEQWLATNAAAFDLIEKGLAKHKAQAPRVEPTELSPLLVPPRKIVRARLFQADRAASNTDHITATNLLLGNLKFATLFRDAEGPAISYLVARAARSFSETGLVRWAWCSEPDAALIRQVLKNIPELDDELPAYEQTMRVEFTEYIARDDDIDTIHTLWVEPARTNEWVLAMQSEDMQRALFIVHDRELMALHPKPLDVGASLSYYARRFRQYFAYTRQPWNRENQDLLAEEWQRVHDTYVKDIQPLLKATKNESVPLSKAAAKKVAKHYRRIENPVGRHWQANTDSLTRTFVTVFQSRTQRNATRTLLALRVYELEQGKLPAALDELVVAGFLDKLPMDYFANAPLRYSKDKRTLWSVAENAVDDGGDAEKSSWIETDMVWKVPDKP
jgi:hypothetical protein